MKKYYNYIEEIISGFALIIVILSVVINVLMRYIFSISYPWLGEVTTISFAWALFVGASACYKRNMHIGIDVIVDLFPQSIKHKIQVSVNMLLLLINIYIFYLSIIFSIQAWSRPTPILRIPYTVSDLSLVVGFGFILIHSFKDLFDRMNLKKSKCGW